MFKNKRLSNLIIPCLICIGIAAIGLLLILFSGAITGRLEKDETVNGESATDSYPQAKIKSDFILDIPSMDSNSTNEGVVEGYFLADKSYILSKANQYSLDIQGEDSLKVAFGTVIGDAGFGFLTYIPEYTKIFSPSINKELFRVLVEDQGEVQDAKGQLGDFNYYFYYTDSFKQGAECETLEGYSCPSTRFSIQNGNESQLFRFICGVKNKIDAIRCDSLIENLYIDKIRGID